MLPLRRALRKGGRVIYSILALPVSLVYGALITLRNWLYDKGWLPTYKVPCTVVSIGNLTLGGSGKTPFALFLLEWLSEQGIAAAYLSRGYGRKTKGFAEVSLQSPQAVRLYGDEPCLVKKRFPQLPVAVAEDRVKGAQELLARYPHLQVLVLDDAYQHRRIHRDLNVLLIDMQRPIWRDWLFPLGRLREPLNAYRRANLIVLNKKSSLSDHNRLRFQVPTLSFEYVAQALIPARAAEETLPLQTLRYRSVIAFCGIAHPESFFTTLRQAGAYIIRYLEFPDHYLYKAADLLRIRREYRRYEHRLGIKDLLLLTTEKDLIRLEEAGLLHVLDELPLYAVRIAMLPQNPKAASQLLHHFFGNILKK